MDGKEFFIGSDAMRYDPETGHITNSKGRRVGFLNAYGYRTVKVEGRNVFEHRLAWMLHYGHWPTELDHINGDRADNRLANLREVTRSENCRNRADRGNKWGIPGVSWRSCGQGGWAVFIHNTYLGFSQSFLEACCLRKSAELGHGYTDRHGK